MKSTTIYELLSYMKKGYVCYDSHFGWQHFEYKPHFDEKWDEWDADELDTGISLKHVFNISPFDGDPEESIICIK